MQKQIQLTPTGFPFKDSTLSVRWSALDVRFLLTSEPRTCNPEPSRPYPIHQLNTPKYKVPPATRARTGTRRQR
jgi:hypothetical protein